MARTHSAHPAPSNGEVRSEPGVRVASDIQPSSAGDPWDHLRGKVISDKYRLVAPLSQGGMGCVWTAHNEVLDVQVAIKLLHERLHHPELAERLVQEARLAARVEHRNIVRVHDLGFTAWRAPYIVMELLDGHDLRDELLDRGAMTPIKAVRTLLPVLEGLAYAHDRGVVHRDLKPENIFLAKTDGLDCIVPKLVDFGIARSLIGPEPERRITRRGSVFGSVNYLSPEQAEGSDDVDQRADLWAFCTVLYECITGVAAFEGDDSGRLLLQILACSVKEPREHGVDDGGLWPIIARGLTRDRDERWQDARSLGRALTEWLALQGIDEDVCGSSTRTRWFGSIPDLEEVSQVRAALSAPPPRQTRMGAVITELRARASRHPLTTVVTVTSLAAAAALAVWTAFPSSAQASDRTFYAQSPDSERLTVSHVGAESSATRPGHAAQTEGSQRARSKTNGSSARGKADPTAQPAGKTAAARVQPQQTPRRYDPVLGF